MIKLFANDVFLDIKDSTKIGITYAVSDFGKVETRQGISSNEFDLLLTNKNLNALGLPQNLNSFNKTSVYKEVKCVLFKDSVVIGQGSLQIVSISDVIKVTFIGGNADWFKIVGNINLQSIDLQRYSFIWNNANVNTLLGPRNNALLLPLYFPKLDYGLLETRTTKNFVSSELYPAFAVKDLVIQCFNDNGFKVKGDFLNDTYFERMYLPYSSQGKPKYPDGFFEGGEFFAIDGGEFFFTTNPQDQGFYEADWNFDIFNMNIQKSGWFNGTFYERKIPTNYQIEIILESSYVRFDFWNTFGFVFGDNFGNFISINQSNQGQYIFFFDNFKRLVIKGTAPLLGDVLNLKFGASVRWIGAIDPDILKLISIRITPLAPTNDEILFNSLIYPNWFLPKMKFADLLKTLVNVFGLYFRFDSFENTIYIEKFENLLRTISNALDWSEKTNKKELSFDYTTIIQNYFKNSQWKYKNAEADNVLQEFFIQNDKEFGSAIIKIENDFIEQDGVIFESVFSGTLQRQTFNNTTYLPFIPCFTNAGQARNPNSRFLFYADLIDFSKISNAPTYTLDGSVKSSIDLSYFTKIPLNVIQDELYSQNFDFDSLKSTYLKFIFEILQRPAFVEVDMRLSAVDVANFDFTKVIYINYPYNAFFYVNRIIEFGSEELTKVELIKI